MFNNNFTGVEEMVKWHVNDDGVAAKCTAKIKCRLGGDEVHGETKRDVLEKFENKIKVDNLTKILSTVDASLLVPKEQRPQPITIFRDRNFDVAPELIEVPHDKNAKYAVLSDVDGTLTRGSLVLDHAIYLHDRGLIDLGSLPKKWTGDPKNEKLIVQLAERYRDQITGKTLDALHVDEFLNDYEKIDGKFYSTMGQLRTFKERGWEVQLISGSPDFLVKPFAERNGFYGKGSDYKVSCDGVLTGDVVGMFGHEAKEGYISKLNIKRFKRVLAFGDTASDVPLFNNSHHSTLVDPSQETEAMVKASLIIRD